MTQPKKDPEFCGHCRTQVSTTGPAPRHGLPRYCGKPECRAAKARALRKKLPTPARRDAPSICSGCSADLPARKWRAGDEFGRFCRKASCRGKRDRMRAELGTAELAEYKVEKDREVEVWKNTADYLTDGLQEPRIRCERCGLDEALSGWPHLTNARNEPSGQGKRCEGTMFGAPSRPIAFQYLNAVWVGAPAYVDID